MKVVVTGSSSGIGRALAARLLERGDEVWGLARSAQASPAPKASGAFRAVRCDVSKWPEVEQAAREAAAAWGMVDALVACAGVQGEIGPIVTADPVRWAETVHINLNGTFHALRAFHPLMAQPFRRAKVVCFSGGGSTKARPNFSAYGAAKTAVVRLVETAAEELRGQPIDINAIAPGAIDTRMTDQVLALGPEVAGKAEYETALKQKAGQGGSLERALDLVEWLISPASDGISGRLISAPWDPWNSLESHAEELAASDIYTLRRITPEDRGRKW